MEQLLMSYNLDLFNHNLTDKWVNTESIQYQVKPDDWSRSTCGKCIDRLVVHSKYS